MRKASSCRLLKRKQVKDLIDFDKGWLYMQKIIPEQLTDNCFDLIGKQWAMVTSCGADGKVNTMTASWGGLGILWRKPVSFVFLRPQRFTRELVDDGQRFSLCFLPERYRDQMNYCGSHSGRDEDKLKACGLSSLTLDDTPVLTHSRLALVCRKLYRQALDPDCFIDKSCLESNYPQMDYHIMYVSEIISAYADVEEPVL